ncbi:hypothetical protein MKS88_005348 [Plasmodium brasilianum]|uniref:Uncharacterized protein n=1 Tax=Plasmodium brasilianum TaxID=5824 RepID=A0ACB9Y2J0_PLABR|nr:hypothetical protein MKS88_005348 [Plasmodium brasilianum]
MNKQISRNEKVSDNIIFHCFYLQSFFNSNENNEHVQKEKNLGNFEIMKDKNNVSNIELKSSTFFNILASTRLMQSVGQPISHSPVYRYIHNIHDHNENNGAVLTSCKTCRIYEYSKFCNINADILNRKTQRGIISLLQNCVENFTSSTFSITLGLEL